MATEIYSDSLKVMKKKRTYLLSTVCRARTICIFMHIMPRELHMEVAFQQYATTLIYIHSFGSLTTLRDRTSPVLALKCRWY